MKTEHPILFSGEMVRAIIEGKKTMTRRAINRLNGIGKITEFQKSDTSGYDYICRDNSMLWNGFHEAEIFERCSYGRPGDSFWVKETFAYDGAKSRHIEYRATWKCEHDFPGVKCEHGPNKWKPSIFMPRWASRISLEITDVRSEKLQEITSRDAIAEGMRSYPGITYQHLNETEPLNDFKRLWDSLNLKRGYGWCVNPFVWVISFNEIGRIDK